jgi:hypothetical protein
VWRCCDEHWRARVERVRDKYLWPQKFNREVEGANKILPARDHLEGCALKTIKGESPRPPGKTSLHIH